MKQKDSTLLQIYISNREKPRRGGILESDTPQTGRVRVWPRVSEKEENSQCQVERERERLLCLQWTMARPEKWCARPLGGQRRSAHWIGKRRGYSWAVCGWKCQPETDGCEDWITGELADVKIKILVISKRDRVLVFLLLTQAISGASIWGQSFHRASVA